MKKIICISLIVICLFVLFGPEALPNNLPPQDILSMVKDRDVVIFFNSGGWGDVPFEKADDFAPIVQNMQESLDQWGYSSIILPHTRAKDDFLGRLAGLRETLNNFRYSSNDLACKIELINETFPDKKIIIAGLSNGGAFVNKTYQNLSGKVRDSSLAVAVGAPFWADNIKGDNVLQVDNEGKDTLVKGKVSALLLSLIKSPFKWIKANFAGEHLPFAKAFQAPGHVYDWQSPEVGSKIIGFLSDKFR